VDRVSEHSNDSDEWVIASEQINADEEEITTVERDTRQEEADEQEIIRVEKDVDDAQTEAPEEEIREVERETKVER
jgi:hypothetical protein